MAREFPILRATERGLAPSARRSVPWAWVAPLRPQAKRNHDQTLERLAERGGLSPGELYCLANGKSLGVLLRKALTDEQAECWLATWDGTSLASASADGAIDLAELDPGIRETVRRLRAAGFRTTDSGDGVSKVAAGWDPDTVHDFPHVYVAVGGDALIGEARRLRDLLVAAGVPVEPLGPDGDGIAIQAMYDPADDSAIIMLAGLDDRGWA